MEKEAQKTLALTKVLENADLALQQAAKAADGKPRRKLPSGALPAKAQPRRKKGKPGTKQNIGSVAHDVGQEGSSFVLPAVNGAAPAPEPEHQVSAANEVDESDRSSANKSTDPEQRTKKSSKLSKGERAALASCHRKPGGAYYPRTHPYLKDNSPSDRSAFPSADAYAVCVLFSTR